MKRNIRYILIGLTLLLMAGGAAKALFRQPEEFDGSRIKNEDEYLLSIERMNGTDLHTLTLQKDDILHIRFETEQGSLNMEIKAPDGGTVYRGNGKEITDFTVNIVESGVYAIAVEARRAKGVIHIQRTGDAEAIL